MRIYLIRHSMTKGNKEKRYIGTTDESLCLEGIQLLEERKGMYPEVTYVYVSPMKRCVQTAEIIYPEMMKAGAYSCNEKLRECDFGLFENHNYIELSGCPEYQAWIDSGGKLPFPEGESREAFIRRTLEGFWEVVRDAQAHDRETIAVVAHGGTIMSIMERYAVKEDGTPAGSYYDYQIKNGEGYELILADAAACDRRRRRAASAFPVGRAAPFKKDAGCRRQGGAPASRKRGGAGPSGGYRRRTIDHGGR